MNRVVLCRNSFRWPVFVAAAMCVVAAAHPAPAAESEVVAALAEPITVVLDRYSADTVLQRIAAMIDVPLEFEEKELKAEGFDRWRTIGVELDAQPAGVVLRKLLRTYDPEERLVFVVKRAGDKDRESIVVTTRAAVKRRGETLPREYEAPLEVPYIVYALGKRLTLKPARDDMQSHLRRVSEAIGLPIEVREADLERAGFSSGVSVELGAADEPVRDVLRKIFRLRDGAGDQIVYVIRPTKPGGRDAIVVTTRTSAAARGYDVPAEFVTYAADPAMQRALMKKITIEYDRNNFDGAAELISDEIEQPVEINRRDLMLEGITNCASHGLELRDLPAEQVLCACLKKYRNENVIFVVRREQPGEPEKIIVTTRAAAAKRGDTVPQMFALPKREKKDEVTNEAPCVSLAEPGA